MFLYDLLLSAVPVFRDVEVDTLHPHFKKTPAFTH